MPLAATVHELVQSLIGRGFTDEDFAMLLEQQANASGLELEPENLVVSDGLEDGD